LLDVFLAVLGGDAAVGPDFDWEHEFVGGDRIVVVALAVQKLLDADELVVGDFSLGFLLGGENDRMGILVASGHGALKYGGAEDSESGPSGARYCGHG
jgi:hypothetical protein